tara:strand:- start:203 stop:481 length:279 start_codon:yes stop_codon:yes gene_type:complete
MALPLIPLAARAAASLAKNKKMRDALTKSVSKATKTKKGGKIPKFISPSGKGLSTAAKVALGFAGGTVVGKETERYKRIKQQKKTGKAYKIR